MARRSRWRESSEGDRRAVGEKVDGERLLLLSKDDEEPEWEMEMEAFSMVTLFSFITERIVVVRGGVN